VVKNTTFLTCDADVVDDVTAHIVSTDRELFHWDAVLTTEGLVTAAAQRRVTQPDHHQHAARARRRHRPAQRQRHLVGRCEDSRGCSITERTAPPNEVDLPIMVLLTPNSDLCASIRTGKESIGGDGFYGVKRKRKRSII